LYVCHGYQLQPDNGGAYWAQVLIDNWRQCGAILLEE
jgi:hypothetical protein